MNNSLFLKTKFFFSIKINIKIYIKMNTKCEQENKSIYDTVNRPLNLP